MSITIKLYINTTENNRVDKSSYLSDLTAKTVTGSFRTPVDIFNPTILIDLSITEATKYNYMYIADFKRYYFITGVVLKSGSTYSAQESSGLFEISGHVDVLYSYKTKITANEAWISRQAGNLTPEIVDRMMPFWNSVARTYLDFSLDPFKCEYDPNDADTLYKNNVVFVISNNVTEMAGTYTPLTGITPFVQPNPYMTTLSMTRTAYCMNYGRAQALLSTLNTRQFASSVLKELFGQTAEAIVSIMIFPFDIKNHGGVSGTLQDIYVVDNKIQDGSTPPTVMQGYDIKRNFNAVFDLGTVDLQSYENGDFRDFEPYTTYEIYLPYVGFVSLDSSDLAGETIGIKYTVDILTGDCQAAVYLYNDANKRIIKTAAGKMGIECPITNSNATEIARNGILATANGVKSVLSGEHPASAFIQAGLDIALNPYKQTGGLPQSGISMWMPSKATLIMSRMTAENPEDMETQMGYACQTKRTLSTLSGYTEVETIHLENMDPATSTEINEIEQLLKSGVIL